MLRSIQHKRGVAVQVAGRPGRRASRGHLARRRRQAALLRSGSPSRRPSRLWRRRSGTRPSASSPLSASWRRRPDQRLRPARSRRRPRLAAAARRPWTRRWPARMGRPTRGWRPALSAAAYRRSRRRLCTATDAQADWMSCTTACSAQPSFVGRRSTFGGGWGGGGVFLRVDNKHTCMPSVDVTVDPLVAPPSALVLMCEVVHPMPCAVQIVSGIHRVVCVRVRLTELAPLDSCCCNRGWRGAAQ